MFVTIVANSLAMSVPNARLEAVIGLIVNSIDRLSTRNILETENGELLNTIGANRAVRQCQSLIFNDRYSIAKLFLTDCFLINSRYNP